MCAWLRFLGLSARYAVVLVLCLCVSYLRPYGCNFNLCTICLLLLPLIILLFLPAGVQNPGFGRVHTILLNPGYCRVQTIPLNPDLSWVHSLLLGFDQWFTRPRVHPNLLNLISIPDSPRCWQNMSICHRAHRFWGRMCGYWVPFLAVSLYDRW
jgi:hypothetical protein